MKTFSFFNLKGGSGKTTLLILLASYLQYCRGYRVKVIDSQHPGYPVALFRNLDQKNVIEDGSYLANYLKKRSGQEPFAIETIGQPVNRYKADDIRRFAWKVNEEVKRARYDYMLLDFPAGYSDFTPVSCLVANHILDGIYVPLSTDAQEYADAFRLARNFEELGQPYRLLWYRLHRAYLNEKAGILNETEQKLMDLGIEFSGVRIKYFNKATESSDVRCFVRNTLCWPDRYVKMVCPELPGLFDEIISFLG